MPPSCAPGRAPRSPPVAHGTEVPLYEGEKVIVCTYHPSQRNVFTGLLTAAMFDAVLKRCRALL